MPPTETSVPATTPLPPGYCFIPKGDVYITKNCRLRTLAANRPLYIVHDARDRRIGLRCPSSIAAAVEADSRATAATRAAAVQKRDASHEKAFEAAVVELFPKIPRELVPGVVKHAVMKRSGRVGRTGTLDVRERAKLAGTGTKAKVVVTEAGKKQAGTAKGGITKGVVKKATAEVIDLTDLTDDEVGAVETSSGEDEIFILSGSGEEEESESESDWSDSDADDGPALRARPV
ncbi:hypothetical protein B0T18DRAFT_474535 [Schizothecium vesticola]|uniref:DUF2293 domain-containing protein n=1 Tax=Schizothecium vesticola TaxID=314040 RepID=A0AA40EFS8_9PEZI|nr:hypothetical protein B0T18DRAFT_474535 [Schizothecium vesticola]